MYMGSGLQDGAAYIETFMTVIRNVTKEETIQYVLAHLDNVISGDVESRLVTDSSHH